MKVDGPSIWVGNEKRKFTFDDVIDPGGTQDDLFQRVGKPIADSCLEGYNGTIIAYGQTGDHRFCLCSISREKCEFGWSKQKAVVKRGQCKAKSK